MTEAVPTGAADSDPRVPEPRDPQRPEQGPADRRRGVRLAIPGVTTLEVDHLRDGPRVNSAELRRRRDRTTAAALPLVTAALGVLLLVGAVLRQRAADDASAAAAAIVAVSAGAGLLATAIVVARWRPVAKAHLVALAVLLTTAVALSAEVLFGGTLAPTAYLELLLLVAGATMLRPGWFIAALAGIWSLWLAVTITLAGTADLGGWALAMLAATVMSVVIHTMRTDSMRALGGALLAAQVEAVRDPLTGLLNRRGITVVGAEVMALARRAREPVSVTLVDVDDRTPVNDTLGRDSGDRIATTVADALGGVFRQADVVARVDGDEFVVVSLGAGPRVEEVERRVRDRLAASVGARSGVTRSDRSPGVVAGRVIHLPWQDEILDAIVERARDEARKRRGLQQARAVDGGAA